MGITVDGGSDVTAALAKASAEIRAALAQAVEAESAAVVADARANVRVRTGDLQQMIAATVDDLSAVVSPDPERSELSAKDAAIKAQANEFGRSNDPGQPYMVPAAELARQRWPARAAAAVKQAVD